MGKRSEPTQAKILKGNFRPWRDTHGPKVDIRLPPCPKWLPRGAKRYWAELGPQLVSAGLLSAIDGDVFALHCDSLARYAEVTQRLKSLEGALDKTPQGYQVQSALFTIRSKLHEQLVRTGREFGLTPSARSGLKDNGQQRLPLDAGDGWDNI